MNAGKIFLAGKEKAVQDLAKATDACEVDDEILSLVTLINQSDSYYTSSSCAGRILIIELPKLGDKRNAVFLGRWHHPITTDEIKNALKNQQRAMVWLLAQAPIIHVTCRSLETAEKLVKCANSCGFKNSSIRSVSKRIVVELASTERLDTPLCYQGNILYSEEQLELVVEIANQIIYRAREKINRLEKKIRDL
ncbi:MAG: hypothetical protein QXL17_04760 [Candidatus Thermoplasmatota archaeon]